MKIIISFLLCFLLISCDGGLAPSRTKVGFSGTVRFLGTWPPQDSLITLLIFASEVYPLDSAKVISGLFSDPATIFMFPGLNQSLPLNVDSIPYSFILPPGIFKYIGVIQQVDPDFANRGIRAFRVIGFYSDSTDPALPGTVHIQEGEMTSGIDIDVDFQNIPIQPF
jgi:hypothetical protein